jgi:hypothetical protein
MIRKLKLNDFFLNADFNKSSSPTGGFELKLKSAVLKNKGASSPKSFSTTADSQANFYRNLTRKFSVLKVDW